MLRRLSLEVIQGFVCLDDELSWYIVYHYFHLEHYVTPHAIDVFIASIRVRTLMFLGSLLMNEKKMMLCVPPQFWCMKGCCY